MIRVSITFRLLSFIAIAFVVTTFSVLYLATNVLTTIIDDSQRAEYSDKLEAILETLDSKVQRLELTRNVEAYEEGFKKSSLQSLDEIYYRSSDQKSYPFILGSDGKILMHPKLINKDFPLSDKAYIKKILSEKNGDFHFTENSGQQRWVIFRYFDNWDWFVCYTIPLDVKYADVRQFRNSLIMIMGVITTLVIAVLSLLIARFTKPISTLTKISSEMAKGNLEIPIRTSGNDEVGVLSRSFVHMRDSIREKIQELEEENIRRRSAQAEQARLIKILESTSDLVATVRTDLSFMYMNLSGRKMVGWSESENEDLSSKRISDTCPQWAFEVLKNEGVPSAIALGLWEGETALIGPDGKEISVSQVIMSHKSPVGEIEYLSTIIRDITERKNAEIAIKESEEKFRTLTNNLNVGVYRNRAGSEGKFIEANPAIVQLFGYDSKEAFLETNAADLYQSPYDRKKFNDKMERYGFVLNEEEPLQKKDGTPFIASISAVAVTDENGELKYYDGIVDDITERKRMEEALRQSEEKYRTVLESIKDGYFEVDISGKFTFFNDALSEILKYEKDELIGMSFRNYMDDVNAEKVFNEFKKVYKTGVPTKTVDWQLIRKDGSECFIETVASPIRTADGRPIGFRGVARDVTDRKSAEREKNKLEAQLQQAQKMEALGTLAGGIAHDFNNILMGIQGRTSLMLTKTKHSNFHFEHLKGIEEYIKSAKNLTKQLLGFARGGKYEIKPTNLNELIKKQDFLFGRTRKEIYIHEKFEQDLWSVEIDRRQIEQVLLNIYVNAWQAMPGGGDLFILTRNMVINENDGNPFELDPGSYVKISITDTGVGMDEDTRSKIFDPFFTTKGIGRGTGLGLASAYGIVKNHRGYIKVYSEKGHGATFNIYLPASEKMALKENEMEAELVSGTETILLVDDEDIIIEVGQEMFKSLGYTVMVANGGKAAVDIFNKEHEAIDLVVLDMIMPDMSGRETFDKLKEIDPDIKVLLSSGYSINGQANEIMERGCNGFIQKPFNLIELSKKLREILNS